MNFPIFIILFIFLLIDSIENNYFNDYSFKEVSKKEKLLLNELESINYNNLENNFLNKNLYFRENKKASFGIRYFSEKHFCNRG